MKITQTAVNLQSQHASASLQSRQTTMRAWVGDQHPDFEGRRTQGAQASSTKLSLSALALARAYASLPEAAADAVTESDAVRRASESVHNDPRLSLLMAMVEAITGRAVRVFDARELQVEPQATVSAAAPVGNAKPDTAPAASVGWGVEIDTREVVSESETTKVQAQGVVQTADGQQIRFSLKLEMSRAFVQESTVSIREGDAVRKDPLVINFDGAGVQLADTQFAFDLNADGQSENIAFVAGGSGFLALDNNADGRINDGTELFGTRSGDGFADLARFDQDGNHWIDEGDAVYSQLRVWQRDASGQDHLSSLSENGVGALYLGRVASPFSVKTASNQTLAQVRSTGLFLRESGLAGTLQQVDL